MLREMTLKAGFTSDGVGVVRAHSVKIKNRSRNQSHKRDGIRVGRIRTFPFSSESGFDSVVYDRAKTSLSESEAEAEELNQSQCTFPRFVIGFISSSASACDSDNLVFT